MLVVPANKNKADMLVEAAADAKISLHKLKVIGKYEWEGEARTTTAVFAAAIDETTKDQLQLAVTMPTPFKYQAEYSIKFAASGSVYRKRYAIERGGYEGPFEVSLADRQGRHLQGGRDQRSACQLGRTNSFIRLRLRRGWIWRARAALSPC